MPNSWECTPANSSSLFRNLSFQIQDICHCNGTVSSKETSIVTEVRYTFTSPNSDLPSPIWKYIQLVDAITVCLCSQSVGLVLRIVLGLGFYKQRSNVGYAPWFHLHVPAIRLVSRKLISVVVVSRLLEIIT